MTAGEGPRWPPDARISPSALDTYGTCPYRTRLQYIDKRSAPHRYSLPPHRG